MTIKSALFHACIFLTYLAKSRLAEAYEVHYSVYDSYMDGEYGYGDWPGVYGYGEYGEYGYGYGEYGMHDDLLDLQEMLVGTEPDETDEEPGTDVVPGRDDKDDDEENGVTLGDAKRFFRKYREEMGSEKKTCGVAGLAPCADGCLPHYVESAYGFCIPKGFDVADLKKGTEMSADRIKDAKEHVKAHYKEIVGKPLEMPSATPGASGENSDSGKKGSPSSTERSSTKAPSRLDTADNPPASGTAPPATPPSTPPQDKSTSTAVKLVTGTVTILVLVFGTLL